MSAEATLGAEPCVHPMATIKDCQLGEWTEVGAYTSMTEVVFEDYSYIMNNADVIYAHIGRFCSIAAYTRLNPGNHPLHRAALHHFTYRSALFDMGKDDDEFFEGRRQRPVVLGPDVWIGHGVVVMPGVTIGAGAAVGSNSVVTKDVAPFTVVAGVPAKPIRQRFPDEVAQGLLDLAWWEWPHHRLRDALPDFRRLGAAEFVAKYRG